MSQSLESSTVYSVSVERQRGSLVVFWIFIAVIIAASLIVISSLIVVFRKRMKEKKTVHPMDQEEAEIREVCLKTGQTFVF